MKSLIAFTKKERMEQLRSGRLVVLALLFVVFGIMNPAIAKLTPWLFELLADTMKESGMIVTGVQVNALTSWEQFYKNIPMALIVFVLMESNIFTKEYQSGTLIPVLTKGVERYKVVISKTLVLTVLWTAGYWMCYGVTYAYNAYFWDNGIARNLLFSATCWWMFGMFTVMLMVLFSSVAKAYTGVLLGTGGVVLACYLLTFLPEVSSYSPGKLMGSGALLGGKEAIGDYVPALVITALLCGGCVAGSIPVLNKRKL